MAPKPQDLRMKMLNFGYTMGFTVIRWDGSAQVLRISPSRVRSAWNKIQILLVLMYEVFLVYQAVQPVKSGNLTDKMQIIYVAGTWILNNSYNIESIWTSEYVALMNKLCEYNREFKHRK